MSIYILVSPQYGYLSYINFKREKLGFSEYKSDAKQYRALKSAQAMCRKVLEKSPKTYMSVKEIGECPRQVKIRKFNTKRSQKAKEQMETALVKVPASKARLYVAINIPIAPMKVTPTTLVKLTGLDKQRIMIILRYLDETETCFIDWDGGWFYKTEEDMLNTISALEESSGYKLGDAMKTFDDIEALFDSPNLIMEITENTKK